MLGLPDGVLMKTAEVHARAWKPVLDRAGRRDALPARGADVDDLL